MEDAVEPLGKLLACRYDVRNARVANLALGTNETLRERLLRHQKGTRDLRCAQPSQQSERQRHLRVEGQRRVAAREDQPESVVLDRWLRVHGGFSSVVRVGRRQGGQ